MSSTTAMVHPLVSDPLVRQLQERFGLESFRPWQREAIDALLEGSKRVLVVAPTGGGKSLTYQLPATLLEGTTVVISPLIALMEDQVRGLRERGIEATFLASTLSLPERREREAALAKGAYDLVYVAPESLGSERMQRLLARLRPPLVAIDEAHCISQWGHDFRPDYMRLGGVVASLRPAHVLACTATATPVVREEILARLGLDGAKTILRGFARPNLHLSVAPVDKPKVQRQRMKQALKDALGPSSAVKGAGIVYTATRKAAEKAGKEVAGLGYRSAVYHAGMEAEDRARVNAAFGAGELDVVCATNAFGMGIDRPDIRIVVHTQAPGSIEAYYQEVGRAGRDGKPAHGLLLSSSSDLGLRRRLIDLGTSGEAAERKWGLFLDLMRYVEAGSCRHDFVLRYFGDEEELLGGCGHCDVCERLDGESEDRQVSEADAIVVRKALSGVARARGKVGLRAVAQMLAGKKTKMGTRWGFDRLSTFGLFSKEGEDWVVALLRRLIAAGLANLTSGEYPKLYLTKRGISVMKGKRPVEVFPPDEVKARRKREKRAVVVADVDADTFEKLRAVRVAEAKSRGVPAYVVCSDRTLAAIAEKRPTTREELARIPGMGPARIESYGEVLLDALR